jgi:acetyl-CoA C-acetyltransferase
MIEVVIAGIGQTPVGEHWEQSLRELALTGLEGALQDSGGLQPEALFVGNMLAPMLSQQAHLGALVADFAGLTGIEAATLESAGASGGAALRAGYLAVASGQANAALVVGVEKYTDQIGARAEANLMTAADSDYESAQGLTPNAQAALLMQRYLHESGAPRGAFAGFPLVAHENGAGNPQAMYRKAISEKAYQNAGMVSEPLNLFDIAPLADGAAAVLLVRRELLPARFPHPLVRISGSAVATDTLALHDRRDPLTFTAARTSIDRACHRAGVMPGEVDLFELHDSYSIFAALSLEAAGFAERGCGWRLAAEGETRQIARQGLLPVSTMGGLKARGNPGGATGVYQAVEAALQLRGEAGPNQVDGARRALIQCLGGPASSAITHVLETAG